jgi:hypothetical protein
VSWIDIGLNLQNQRPHRSDICVDLIYHLCYCIIRVRIKSVVDDIRDCHTTKFDANVACMCVVILLD